MTNFDEIINYSFYVFEHNFIELEKYIDSYTDELYSQDITAFDLRNRDSQAEKFEEVKKEIARLLHNYSASWFSLREQTFAEEKSLEDSSLISEIEDKKRELLTDNPENGFIQGLRNYIQHKRLPLIDSKNSIGFKFGEPSFNIEHSLYLDTNKLLEWKKWNSNAKKYLTDHSDKIPIKETIKINFYCIKEFYQWLESKLN